MHVIVGQGQLDTILRDPRGPARLHRGGRGVVKHRKRKEKALRKLDSTDRNLTRLGDLLSDPKAAGPPGRGRPQGGGRPGRRPRCPGTPDRRRPGHGAHGAAAGRHETILVERREEVEAAIAQAQASESGSLRDDLPALARAQETWFGLSGMRERLRGTASLAAERVRNAAGSEQETLDLGRDPDELEAEAGRIREQEAAIAGEVDTHRAALEAAVTTRRTSEEAAAEEERRVAGLLRAAADRREGLARLAGQVNAVKSRAAAADEEVGRLEESRSAAAARAARAQHDFTALETRIAGLDAGEEGLDAEHEAARPSSTT